MTPDPLAERLDAVRAGIADAASSAGRSVDDITTVVVTKFHPVSLIESLLELGVHDIGENRHQEARQKAEALSGRDVRWHIVGQLQSKKARQARTYAHTLHSLDRPSLLDALSGGEGDGAEGEPLECFVQVNLTDDPGRGGVAPGEFENFVEAALGTRGIRIAGVMAVAPIDEEPRAAFTRVRELSDRLTALEPSATALSIGMSDDYADAVREGATHLRIGRAITGERPTRR